MAKMFVTTLFLLKRPRAAQQANELNGELPSQQTLGFRRRELRIHAHNVHSSSVFRRHFGTASCLPTRRNPPRSSQKVTELPQKSKTLSKASHPAQCCLLGQESRAWPTPRETPASLQRPQRLPASMVWVHGSQKRIRGTESLYFVSVGLVSFLHTSNNKRHMKRRLSLVQHQS